MADRRHRRPTRAIGLVGVLVLVVVAGCSGGDDGDPITVGLITKQEDNPFWVTMREIAEDVAGERDAELISATGESDVDVEAQVEALREMTASGVDGILIAPNDSSAVVPAIEAAREEGIVVIAVDTPTEPESAVDALYATDNRLAGELVGRYAQARAERDGIDPRVALLDLAPGIRSGELRREGFLAGFGLEEGDPRIVGEVYTEGDRAKGEEGMRQLLEEHPDISIVYTVNEPAALGAVEALQAGGRDMSDVVLVSVDGGCEAIKSAVRPGDIDATAQQYPQNMAREGVRAIADAARGGETPTGFLNTGVSLITGDAVDGVESRDVAFGVRNCWGD
ncbi:substrate-binding domain-containing protein [Blastococcus sp. VKM Ac-2987]|uniref:substrate-binding domain-containing protein n=1 Tax=Blastococcus sp. VKM Ac-2987 TaxID=3004141 RepID=UPI0022AB5679|nr:substrate-binding domain-containing protein [Blastococcus sp. VKM Ac-2987]MCZ2860749.1 substrate-binding domain-containing protein [Blastococcus sp. VKM Ac-2987]